MYNLEFLGRPKYFKRTFWIYFAAMTAIVFCAGGFILRTYTNTNQYEEYLKMSTELKESGSDIDNSVKVANVLCQLIQSYDVVEEFAKENISVYSEMNFRRITEVTRLVALHESEFLNNNLSIALKRSGDDLVISKGNTMSTEECFERTGIDFEKIVELFSDDTVAGFYSTVINSENENTMQLVAKKVYSGGASVCFGVNFNVDNAKIYYDETIEKIVVHINKGAEDKLDIDSDTLKLMDADEIRSVQLENGRKEIITPSSNYGNVIYVQSFDKRDEYDNLRQTVIVLIFPCLVFTYVLSLFLARRTYMPIQKIIENLGVVLNGEQDETEAVRSHIMKIQEENSELSNRADESFKMLRNRILTEILNGFFKPGDNELNNYDLEFIKDKCIIVLIECTASDAVYSENAADSILLIAPHITKYFSERIRDNKTVVYLIQEKRILYISSNTDRDVNKILSIIEDARQEFHTDLTVAVGDWKEGISNLQDMYFILESGINNMQIAKGRDIIMLEEIKSFRQSAGYYPLTLEMELSEFVKSGEKAKAINRLERMFSYNEADAGEGFNEFKNLILITIRRILKESDRGSLEIFGDGTDIFKTVVECENKDSLFECVSDIIQSISESVLETGQKNIDSLSFKIMEYINENICKDISINDVIDRFGISASYLTKLLKNNYDISFKKYLNDAKINKAKEIMDNDKTIQIQDVAAMVGFNSSVSFIRAFKRIEGITPKQYLDM